MKDYDDVDWECVGADVLELISFNELVCLLGQYLKEAKKSPPHLQSDLQTSLQHQLRRLDDLLVHASLCKESDKLCQYPKCFKGKLLYRRVFFCKKSECQLCKSIRRLIKFHARACTESNCIVPGCSEIKQKIMCKERLLRRNEQRLERLRQLEPQRAAAAAALQLSLEVSVKAMNQNQNDVNKLSFVSSIPNSQKKKEDKQGEKKFR